MPDVPSPAAPTCAHPPPLPDGFTAIVGHPAFACNTLAEVVTCAAAGSAGRYRNAWRPIPAIAVSRLWPLITPRPDRDDMPAPPEGCTHVAELPGLAVADDGRWYSCRSCGGFRSKNPSLRRFVDEWKRLPPVEVRRLVPDRLIPATKPKTVPFPKPQEERERMLAEVDKLVRSIVTKAGLSAEDREDAEQAARLELWAATEQWNPARGVKWVTYAHTCITRVVNRLKSAQLSRGEVHTDEWDKFPDRANERAGGRQHDDEDEDGGETAAELFAAVQRVLAEGLLDAVTSPNTIPDEATLTARKLIESIAFDGLTVRDLAIQTGHQEKAVRVNLKNAIRTLQRRGLTQHVATDAEVQAVLVPNPVRNEQGKASKRNRRGKNAPFLADPWKPAPAVGGEGQEHSGADAPAGPQTAA
jgi:RNA polymerase sigma factor (sigma-70 family)